MTEPTGGPPQSAAAAAGPASAGSPAAASRTAAARRVATGRPRRLPRHPAGFQTQAVAVEAGPAPGVAYADLVDPDHRVHHRCRDPVVRRFVGGIIFIAIGVALGTGLGLIFGLLGGIVTAGISAMYFIYGWTRMRASLGQKFLSLETVERG